MLSLQPTSCWETNHSKHQTPDPQAIDPLLFAEEGKPLIPFALQPPWGRDSAGTQHPALGCGTHRRAQTTASSPSATASATTAWSGKRDLSEGNYKVRGCFKSLVMKSMVGFAFQRGDSEGFVVLIAILFLFFCYFSMRKEANPPVVPQLHLKYSNTAKGQQ